MSADISACSHFGGSTVSRFRQFRSAARISRATSTYWITRPTELLSPELPKSTAPPSAVAIPSMIATPSDVAISTPVTKPRETRTARCAVARMTADMI